MAFFSLNDIWKCIQKWVQSGMKYTISVYRGHFKSSVHEKYSWHKRIFFRNFSSNIQILNTKNNLKKQKSWLYFKFSDWHVNL